MNGWFIIWTRLHSTKFVTAPPSQLYINDYLTQNGTNVALATDPCHIMTPLYIFTMNYHAPVNTIAALLDANVEVTFHLDNPGKMSLDYARDYNVGGLVAMVNGLCNHRYAAFKRVH